MNPEQLQLKHNDLQNRLIATRERIRQAEAQLQDFANAEQQLLGAIAVMREMMQMVEAPPASIAP